MLFLNLIKDVFSCEDKGIKINKKVSSKLFNVKAKSQMAYIFAIFCLIMEKAIFAKMEDISLQLCLVSFMKEKGINEIV